MEIGQPSRRDWVVLWGPELRLGGDVVVPDLTAWRRERMQEMPDVAYFELAPDWCCEVLSPSTAMIDRTKKLVVDARERVTHVWFVDPIARALEILRLDSEAYKIVQVAGGDEKIRAEPFDAIELELAVLWAR